MAGAYAFPGIFPVCIAHRVNDGTEGCLPDKSGSLERV